MAYELTTSRICLLNRRAAKMPHDVLHAYAKPSCTKIIAEDDIRQNLRKQGYIILFAGVSSYNAYMFSEYTISYNPATKSLLFKIDTASRTYKQEFSVYTLPGEILNTLPDNVYEKLEGIL